MSAFLHLGGSNRRTSVRSSQKQWPPQPDLKKSIFLYRLFLCSADIEISAVKVVGSFSTEESGLRFACYAGI